MRVIRSSAALVAGVAIAVFGTLPASASIAEPGDSGDSGETIIHGGKPQSVDPTAYNYLPPASAGTGIQPMGAAGTQYISPFTYTWKGLAIPVPSGQIYHIIEGDGRYIEQESALYAPVVSIATPWGVNICNWRIDFQNRSATDNSIITTSVGTTRGGCSVLNVKRAKWDFNVQRGKQCARLYVNGTFRGEQCHAVY